MYSIPNEIDIISMRRKHFEFSFNFHLEIYRPYNGIHYEIKSLSSTFTQNLRSGGAWSLSQANVIWRFQGLWDEAWN